MKTSISFTPIKYYNWKNIDQWIWHFHTYKSIKGFILRIFGIYINVRENDATEKLITKFHENRKYIN